MRRTHVAALAALWLTPADMAARCLRTMSMNVFPKHHQCDTVCDSMSSASRNIEPLEWCTARCQRFSSERPEWLLVSTTASSPRVLGRIIYRWTLTRFSYGCFSPQIHREVWFHHNQRVESQEDPQEARSWIPGVCPPPVQRHQPP